MQRIERYGVIALVLLLVTIIAVTFWEKSDAASASEREQREGRELVARVDGSRPGDARPGDARSGDANSGSAHSGNAHSGNAHSGNARSTNSGAAHIAPTGPSRAIDRNLPATAPSDNKASQPVTTPDPKPVTRPRSNPGGSTAGSSFPPPAGRRASGRGAPAFKSIPGGAQNTPWSIEDQGWDRDETGRPYRTGAVAENSRDQGRIEPSGTTSSDPGITTAANVGAGPPASAVDVLNSPTLNPSKDGAKLERPAAMKTIAGEKEPATTGGGSYVVQAGDTLSQISDKCFGTSKRWKEIQELNGITDPTKIYVGMKLRLPGAVVAQATSASPVQPVSIVTRTAPAAKGTYVVKKGDVLSVIAQRELGSSKRWREIVALNPKVDPKKLHEGAVLRMPGGRVSASRSNTVVAQAKAIPRKKNRVR